MRQRIRHAAPASTTALLFPSCMRAAKSDGCQHQLQTTSHSPDDQHNRPSSSLYRQLTFAFPATSDTMGKTWGELAYIRNLVIIRMSPYEQRAFAGFWSSSWRGLKRDFFANAPYAVPPFLAGYLLIDWANKENERLSRKNPADFENDV